MSRNIAKTIGRGEFNRTQMTRFVPCSKMHSVIGLVCTHLLIWSNLTYHMRSTRDANYITYASTYQDSFLRKKTRLVCYIPAYNPCILQPILHARGRAYPIFVRRINSQVMQHHSRDPITWKNQLARQDALHLYHSAPIIHQRPPHRWLSGAHMQMIMF